MKARLTKRVVGGLRYEGDGSVRCVLWDTALAGLGCRAFPSGARSFVLSYRSAGRKRLVTLGDAAVLSVDEARKLARKHLVGLADNVDPLAERAAARIRGATVREVAKAFLDRGAERLAAKTLNDYRLRLERSVLPSLGSRPAESVTRQDVARLHEKATRERGPYEGNRTAALIGSIYTFAIRSGLVAETMANPSRGIERNREEPRGRVLSDEELVRLAKAIDGYPNPFIRAALKLTLFLGARKGEMLKLQWSDVDLERRVAVFQKTKNRKSHPISLSAQAVEILAQLPRMEGSDNVFPGESRDHEKPLQWIDRAWRKIRSDAGLEDVHVHDLRRTAATKIASAGTAPLTLARILNHGDVRTTQKHYVALPGSATVEPLDKLGAELARLGVGPSSATMPAVKNGPAKTERGAV